MSIDFSEIRDDFLYFLFSLFRICNDQLLLLFSFSQMELWFFRLMGIDFSLTLATAWWLFLFSFFSFKPIFSTNHWIIWVEILPIDIRLTLFWGRTAFVWRSFLRTFFSILTWQIFNLFLEIRNYLIFEFLLHYIKAFWIFHFFLFFRSYCLDLLIYVF